MNLNNGTVLFTGFWVFVCFFPTCNDPGTFIVQHCSTKRHQESATTNTWCFSICPPVAAHSQRCDKLVKHCWISHLNERHLWTFEPYSTSLLFYVTPEIEHKWNTIVRCHGIILGIDHQMSLRTYYYNKEPTFSDTRDRSSSANVLLVLKFIYAKNARPI